MPTTLVSGSGLGFPQHLRTPCVVLSGLFAHFLYLADVCLLPNVLTLSHFGDGQKCIMLELCHFRGLCFPSHMQTVWTRVLTYPGISHKCWLISEKWGSREETGSNYWISVVSVCAYVCHCCIYVCVCVWCDRFSSLSFSFSPKVTSLSLENHSSLRTDSVLCLLSPVCHPSTSLSTFIKDQCRERQCFWMQLFTAHVTSFCDSHLCSFPRGPSSQLWRMHGRNPERKK